MSANLNVQCGIVQLILFLLAIKKTSRTSLELEHTSVFFPRDTATKRCFIFVASMPVQTLQNMKPASITPRGWVASSPEVPKTKPAVESVA
jgi:hypothetical protein